MTDERIRKNKNRIFKGGCLEHVYCWILGMVFCLILSGCGVVKMSEINQPEIKQPEVKQLEANQAEIKQLEIKQPEIKDLEAGENAFFQKQYGDAAAIFSLIVDRSKDPGLKNIALYNLACTKLVVSENEYEFIEAMTLLSEWSPSKGENGFFENPLLLIPALWKTAEVNKKERLEILKKNKALNAMVKHQNKEIVKMKQIIQNFQRQISELETIDQEIQEKRKTN